MSRIFLVSAFRNLLRHKVQSLINLVSLAIGLAVFGFTFLYVKQELSYDRAWPDADRIHRLVIEQRGIPGLQDGVFNNVAARRYPTIIDYFGPQIEKSTRIVSTGAKFKDSPLSSMQSLIFVDPGFADIFQLEVVEGDLRRVLGGPGFIALEENYATTSGKALVPGDRIVLESSGEATLEYEVGAIYRLPEHISPAVRFSQFTLLHDFSRSLFGKRGTAAFEGQNQIWLTFKAGVSTESFNTLQRTFVDETVTTFDAVLGPERNIADHMTIRWQPLTALHFNPTANDAISGSGDMARVATFAVVGLLVLLVGCSNSVSLSLANAIERRKEVGIRKTCGALPADILRQHLGEAVLLALLAMIPAIAMLKLLLPAYQNLLPFSASITIGWNEYALLALITCVVGLGNGAYPAFVLSGARPEAILKAEQPKPVKGGFSLRALLVGVQFCFASMLLIGTAALYLQLAVTRTQPLGFEANNLVTLFLGNQQERASLSALSMELEKIPGVQQVVPVTIPLNSNMPNVSSSFALVRGSADITDFNPHLTLADPGFFSIMQIPVLAGRTHDLLLDIANPQIEQTSDSGQAQEVRLVINRSTVRALGFNSPDEAVEQDIFFRTVDRTIGEVRHAPARVIGVVEDNMYDSLRRRPQPEIYMMRMPSDGNTLVLKYDEVVESTLQERIGAVAQKVIGQPIQNIIFIEPQLRAAFIQEQNESRLLLICGGLALLLACIGLYGLAAFAIERRVKEVGVRKVMGASVGTIVTLFVWRFSRPVLIANLIAWPIAAYFVSQWIEQFPYQMEKAWLLPLCIGSTFAVLVIALLTVSIITVRAANANPVQSLRYE